MRVWIFQTGEFLPIDGDNIRPMRAINLSEYFIKNGHSVTLLSSDFSHQIKAPRTKKLTTKKLNSNFKLILIPSPGYISNISLKRLFDHFILAVNTFKFVLKTTPVNLPDFVFIGYPPIETSFFLTIWLRHHNIPFCIDVKDQWPHIFLLRTKGVIRKILRIFLSPYFYAAKYSLKRANFLTSITPNFLNWSENFSSNFNPNNKTLYLVPNLKNISDNKLEKNLLWWENKFGLDIYKKNKLIFTGNINNAYNFKDLIAAISSSKLKNKNFEIIICGEGDLKKELESKLNHKKNIFFPGWIEYDKILALKKLSIATLAPYRNTSDFQMSIPNKIIDSLYYGLPIITSLKGEVESLIKKYNVGYFCDDQFTWSEQINICLNNPKERELFSLNAKSLYRNKFTSDLVYGSFVKFIEKNYGNKKSKLDRY